LVLGFSDVFPGLGVNMKAQVFLEVSFVPYGFVRGGHLVVFMELGFNMRFKASGRDTTRIGNGRGRWSGWVKIVKGGLGIAVGERRRVRGTKVGDAASNVSECLGSFVVLEKGTELEPATDELFGVKQGFGGGGEIWKMDGVTRVISACFGFEGVARMEVPFRINVLEDALFGFYH